MEPPGCSGLTWRRCGAGRNAGDRISVGSIHYAPRSRKCLLISLKAQKRFPEVRAQVLAAIRVLARDGSSGRKERPRRAGSPAPGRPAAALTSSGLRAQRWRHRAAASSRFQPAAFGWAWAPGRSRLACSTRSACALSRRRVVVAVGGLRFLVHAGTPCDRLSCPFAAVNGLGFLRGRGALAVLADEGPGMTAARSWKRGDAPGLRPWPDASSSGWRSDRSRAGSSWLLAGAADRGRGDGFTVGDPPEP